MNETQGAGNTGGRLIAIGDPHGCIAALETLLGEIRPRPLDTIVGLGDYIDRGPDSRAVVERMMSLAGQCRLVPLMGNHEEMMLAIRDGKLEHMLGSWLSYGGAATLASYDCSHPRDIPQRHADFLRSCRLWHEAQRYIFMHAGYLADMPLEEQTPGELVWVSLRNSRPGPHCSGKTAIVGHTAQRDGVILDLGHLKCIDTCCYGEGWLTAMDVETGRVWQADKTGRLHG
ncbi:MAG: metallophosphoesterase family protein [Thermoguttaceae bacterium]